MLQFYGKILKNITKQRPSSIVHGRFMFHVYLILFILLLIIDSITLKKHAENNYTYSILMVIIIMTIFTGEFVTISSIITTLLIIAIYLSAKKIKDIKNKKTIQQYNNNTKIGLYLAITNIIYFIYVLIYYKYI